MGWNEQLFRNKSAILLFQKLSGGASPFLLRQSKDLPYGPSFAWATIRLFLEAFKLLNWKHEKTSIFFISKCSKKICGSLCFSILEFRNYSAIMYCISFSLLHKQSDGRSSSIFLPSENPRIRSGSIGLRFGVRQITVRSLFTWLWCKQFLKKSLAYTISTLSHDALRLMSPLVIFHCPFIGSTKIGRFWF